MTRTKAEFRALRETVGMTQAALAAAMGVEVRSVKRWEKPNPHGWYDPPQDAWDVLDGALAAQRRAVEKALEVVENVAEEHGEPQAVELAYWLSEADYVSWSTDSALDAPGDWRMANANARAAASALAALGYRVRFESGAPFPAPDAEISCTN